VAWEVLAALKNNKRKKKDTAPKTLATQVAPGKMTVPLSPVLLSSFPTLIGGASLFTLPHPLRLIPPK